MSSRADADAALAAKQVQGHAPTWFVIWSLRHRRFEAWQCGDPANCHTVHVASAAELWDRMQQADPELWRPLQGNTQPTANAHLGPPAPVTPEHIPGPRPHPDERTRP